MDDREKRYQSQFGPRKEISGRAVSSGGPSSARSIPTLERQYTAAPSNFQKAVTFGKSVGGTIASLPEATAGLAFNVGKTSVTEGYNGMRKFLNPLAQTITGSVDKELNIINQRSNEATRQMEDFHAAYKSGRMSKEAYTNALKDSAKSFSDIRKETEKITQGLDRGDVLEGAAETLINILSAGSYAPLSATVRGGRTLKATSLTTEVLFAKGAKGANALIKVEEAAARIPSVRALLIRNGAKFTGNRGVVNQSVRDAVAGVLFKHPFVYHATIDDVESVMRELDEQNYAGALGRFAFVGTLVFDGGIFGAATKSYGKIKGATKLAAIGRGSYWDEVARATKDGDPRQWFGMLNDMQKTNPARFKRVERVMRQAQEANLRRWNSADEAVEAVKLHYSSNHGVDLSQVAFKDFIQKELNYWDSMVEIDDMARAGKILDRAGEKVPPGKLALGTFDREAREALVGELEKLGFQDRVQYLTAIRQEGNVLWAQHDGLFNKIAAAVAGGDLKKVKNIDTAFAVEGLPKSLAKKLAKRGYVAIAPKQNLLKVVDEKDTRKLITGAITQGTEVFDPAIAPKPVFRNLNGSLRAVGLSTEAANDIAYKQLQKEVVSVLSETNAGKALALDDVGRLDARPGGAVILSKLQQYAEDVLPQRLASVGGRTSNTNAITDIRQLTVNEIRTALKVTADQAKEVSRAVNMGYMNLPLELRGLGDRAVDALHRFVPGYSQYNRLQGALRYTYNPFFRVQEIAETFLLSSLKLNKVNTANLLWGKARQELDTVVTKLDDARIFSTGFSGEGARNDVILGRITANLTSYQKRDLAGLAMDMAKKRGLSVDDMISSHYDEVEDALRVIVQYPRRGAISSPLARTVNLAFFPTRYNIKVASLVAKELGKQPPTVQLATIRGLYQASDWLKSDEGILWQRENSEALGLIKWLTPYGSLESVMNIMNGRPDSISELGLLGGLPFGFITQMLDSNGAFDNLPAGLKYQTPYVNPKTGEVYEDRMPVSLKARANYAIVDFLNSTFTYPGRIIGLPGKREFLRNVADFALQVDSDELERVSREEDLTDLQRRQIEILKKATKEELGDDDIQTLYQSPTGVGHAIPQLEILFGVPKPGKLEKRSELGTLPSKKKKSGKREKKTARPIPT